MVFNFSDYRKRFSGDIFFYGDATHALYDLLVWLQENRPRLQPNIVLPAYIPAGFCRLVLAAGYQARFYDVSPDCRMDSAHVINLIDRNTQAVMCTHFFGIPSEMGEIKSCTGNEDLFLIEDCTHTINSRYNGRELGSVSDAAIFSFRRTLQLSDGGFLILNKKEWLFSPAYSGRANSYSAFCRWSITRLKSAYYQLTQGRDPLNLARIPGGEYISPSADHTVKTTNISWLNRACLQVANLREVSTVNRANFEYLYNGIADHDNIKAVFTEDHETGVIYRKGGVYRLIDGITPTALPVLAPSGTRDMLINILREAGIGCGAGYPEAPFGHREHTGTIELSERLIEIPIHRGINKYQLDRIISCLQYCEKAKFIETRIPSKYKRKSEVA